MSDPAHPPIVESSSAEESAVARSERKKSLVPFVILAATVLIPSAFWYRNTLARRLDDDALKAHFASMDARDLDHAFAEISKRIQEMQNGARPAASVETYYPAVVAAAAHADPQVRLRAAWVMGDDPKAESFRLKLHELVRDDHPLVVWNAAPALAKHGSPAARPMLLAMLEPFEVRSPVDGVFDPEARKGRTIGTAAAGRIGFVVNDAGKVEIMAGVFGPVVEIAAEGAPVKKGDVLAVVGPAQSAALNALGALAIPGVGLPEDVAAIEAFVARLGDAAERQVAAQAKATLARLRGDGR